MKPETAEVISFEWKRRAEVMILKKTAFRDKIQPGEKGSNNLYFYFLINICFWLLGQEMTNADEWII